MARRRPEIPPALPLLLVVLAARPGTVVADESADDFDQEGGWALYIFMMLASFWALAVVVEEYFVPALSVLCEVLDLPDDVAGATFMAAGASSPEMFSAFVSLFVTHSTLGVGTVVGSEIFNHLCICAGSVLYAKSGYLKLDWRILGRDIAFYALAIGALLFCEADMAHPDADEVDDDTKHIYIHWYQALFLICCYAAYVYVCSYYGKVVKLLCPIDKYAPLESAISPMTEGLVSNGIAALNEKEKGNSDCTVSVQYDAVFKEPLVNFQSQHEASQDRQSVGINSIGSDRDHQSSHILLASQSEGAGVEDDVERMSETRPPTNGAPTGRPSFADFAERAVTIVLPESLLKLTAPLDLVENTEASFGCFLWKKSRFYSKVRVSSRAWQLRWCVIDHKGFRSYRERGDYKNIRSFDVYSATKVAVIDEDRNILKIWTPTGNLRFQAPTRAICNEVVHRIESKISQYRTLSTNERSDLFNQARLDSLTEGGGELGPMANEDHEGHEEHESLIAMPSHPLAIFMHLLLFPLKALIYYTIPDVRDAKNRNKYMLASIICVAYLGLFSFTMSLSVEELAANIGMSSVVAGLTISAAGTSFPNILASMIVARQGLGNMAVGNAFGSNVFNIFIGLGLPWFLYCFFGDDKVDKDEFAYYGLSAKGVVFPTVVLGLLLAAFVTLLWFTNMHLYKMHAYVFIGLYVAFLVWAVGWACAGPDIAMCIHNC